MNRRGPLGIRAVIGVGAVAGATLAMVLGAGPADAASTVTLDGTVLTINGDSARNALSVGQTTAGVITLNGTPVLGGTVTANNLSRIVMVGGAADDTLRVDETNGVMTPAIELHGGAGNDQLFGGSGADTLDGGPGVDTLVGNAGADTLLGGAGNDKAIGGPGIDTVDLGEDSDQFTWSPGDGDDHLDGGAGKDTLIVNGFDRTAADPFEQETFQIRTKQGRNIITRVQLPAPNEPDDNINFAGFELLKALMAGGPNAVSFDSSFAASDVAVVRADLGPAVDRSQNQGIGNIAEVFGTANVDGIRISGSPATGLNIRGLGPTELVTGAQNLDVRGNIDGGQGPAGDIIDASHVAPGTVDDLLLIGTDGNDTLAGSPGDDRVFGGNGDDRLEGHGGNDLLDGGTGVNVIIP